MSETQAESENNSRDEGGGLVDNIIVHCSDPHENGGTIIELRLRVVDPSKPATFQGIDVAWSPDDKDWTLEVGTGLTLTDTAVIDINGTVSEAAHALDTQHERDQNTN